MCPYCVELGQYISDGGKIGMKPVSAEELAAEMKKGAVEAVEKAHSDEQEREEAKSGD